MIYKLKQNPTLFFLFPLLIVSLCKVKMGGPDGKGDYATVEKNEKKVFLKMNEQFPYKENFDYDP